MSARLGPGADLSLLAHRVDGEREEDHREGILSSEETRVEEANARRHDHDEDCGRDDPCKSICSVSPCL
mgnify:CR=1 FL=1